MNKTLKYIAIASVIVFVIVVGWVFWRTTVHSYEMRSVYPKADLVVKSKSKNHTHSRTTSHFKPGCMENWDAERCAVDADDVHVENQIQCDCEITIDGNPVNRTFVIQNTVDYILPRGEAEIDIQPITDVCDKICNVWWDAAHAQKTKGTEVSIK